MLQGKERNGCGATLAASRRSHIFLSLIHISTGQFNAVTWAAGTPGHAWQVVAQMCIRDRMWP